MKVLFLLARGRNGVIDSIQKHHCLVLGKSYHLMIDLIHESIMPGLIVLLLGISFIVFFSFISMNLTIPTNSKSTHYVISAPCFECFAVSGLYYHPFFLVL